MLGLLTTPFVMCMCSVATIILKILLFWDTSHRFTSYEERLIVTNIIVKKRKNVLSTIMKKKKKKRSSSCLVQEYGEDTLVKHAFLLERY